MLQTVLCLRGMVWYGLVGSAFWFSARLLLVSARFFRSALLSHAEYHSLTGFVCGLLLFQANTCAGSRLRNRVSLLSAFFFCSAFELPFFVYCSVFCHVCFSFSL
jgi:hypothetical protein